jgi:hypothetical protein
MEDNFARTGLLAKIFLLYISYMNMDRHHCRHHNQIHCKLFIHKLLMEQYYLFQLMRLNQLLNEHLRNYFDPLKGNQDLIYILQSTQNTKFYLVQSSVNNSQNIIHRYLSINLNSIRPDKSDI